MTQKHSNITSETSRDGTRFYSSKDLKDLKFPSVTTLIKKYEPSWGLQKWKENVGEEEARRISQYSASIGTKVHSLNEAFFTKAPYELKCKTTEEEHEIKKRHALFRPFLQYVNPRLVEEKLIWWSIYKEQTIGFGGSADLIGTLSGTENVFYSDRKYTEHFPIQDNLLFVADYKNWRSSKSSQDLLGKYLQLAAYANAVKQFTEGAIQPKHGLILGTTRTSLCLFYLNPEQMKWYWNWFLHMVQMYYSNGKVNWSQFKSHSVGYKLNPDYEEGISDKKEKWIDRDKNYLGKRLYLKN